MAARQVLDKEEAARRDIQRDADKLANAGKTALGPREADVVLDKKAGAPTIIKGGEKVRKMEPPTRRYWPSANSQRAPSRPQGSKRSPR